MKSGSAEASVRHRAQQEAERWFIRLIDSEQRGSLRAEFERWRAARPEHADAYSHVERVWALGQAAARHDDFGTVAHRTAAERQWVPVARIWRPRLLPAVAAAAAMFVLAAAGTYVWYVVDGPGSAKIYATATGQQRMLTLQDGSVVLLDTDSAVAVHYGRRARWVEMQRGRAEFTVRHDPDQPFVVHAGDGVVTDLGTTFQVGIGEHANVNVVLIKGKLSITAANSQTVLHTGEALRYDRTGVVRAAHPADLSYALGWTRGELIVHDWTLQRLVAAMNRYSHVKLKVADPSLANVRVSGTFRTGDQKALVEVLEAGWPVRASQASPTEIRLFRN